MPRTYGKVKQTRLSFTPVASSASPGAERSPGSDRVAKVRYEHPSKVTLSRGLRIDDYPAFSRNDGAAGSVEASSMSTPVKKKKEKNKNKKDGKNKKKGSKSKVKGRGDEGQMKEEESSDDERKESSVGRSQSRLSASSDEDDEIVQASARRRRGQSGVVVFDEDSESDSDSDGSATPVPTTRKSHEGKESREKASSSSSRKLRSGKTSGNKGSNAEMRTPLKRKYTATESEDDSESPVLTGRSSRTRPSTRQPLEQNSSGASDEEEVVAHSTTRRLKRGAAPSTAFPVDDSDDSDDVILSSPAKRRRLDNGPEALRTPRQTSDQDRLDLEEDLEDLKDSAVKKTRTRGRPADSARLTRQKQLELLRRRRAGEKAISVSESQHSDNESDGEGEQSESVEELEDESGSEDSQDSDVEPPVSENEDLDRYEDDFVLQDDEGELGAPTDLADMPFEFTRHSYKKPKEFFRDVVEWMVHNKLNPAFPRNDPVYQVAFMKLEDEVKGRAGSQLVSTVWNSDFRRALMARPQIEVTLFPITEGHPCDACNRSGHPASFDIKLYGKPYSLETLEPLSDDEDSDEQSEESHDTRDKDKDGNPLPDEDRRFYLGRHCKSRATMAHTLVHWRFHLSEWVIGYLEHQGVFSDEKIIERSHWSVKRQTKYANEVVDNMVETGEVKRLWRDFHINLTAARETTESRW